MCDGPIMCHDSEIVNYSVFNGLSGRTQRKTGNFMRDTVQKWFNIDCMILTPDAFSYPIKRTLHPISLA